MYEIPNFNFNGEPRTLRKVVVEFQLSHDFRIRLRIIASRVSTRPILLYSTLVLPHFIQSYSDSDVVVFLSVIHILGSITVNYCTLTPFNCHRFKTKTLLNGYYDLLIGFMNPSRVSISFHSMSFVSNIVLIHRFAIEY